MTTRTRVAAQIARQLETDRETAVQQAAAWLVATGRSRQAKYLVQDVAAALATQGHLSARVTVARPLGPSGEAVIETFLREHTGAAEIELEVIVDPAIIGGVRIETPTAELDATVRRQLTMLVEGVRV